MSQLRFYIDESAMERAVVYGLRSRGFDVLTAADLGLMGRNDYQQIVMAASQDRVLYSCDVSDFHAIHSEWMRSTKTHSGIILFDQDRYSIGEQIRRLAHLADSVTADEMRNRLEFLSNW